MKERKISIDNEKDKKRNDKEYLHYHHSSQGFMYRHEKVARLNRRQDDVGIRGGRR